MAGPVLGHIDCPSCGASKGMRINHDKNLDPFGFCELNCRQQLRVGGDAHRVKQFVARYPWAAKPVTGTAPASAPAPAPASAPAQAKPAPAKPVAVSTPAPVPVITNADKKPAMSSMSQVLHFLGANHP